MTLRQLETARAYIREMQLRATGASAWLHADFLADAEQEIDDLIRDKRLATVMHGQREHARGAA